MDQQVQLIAARLRWARENLEIAPAVMAEANGMSVEEYLRLERGEEDFSFSFLFKCANTLGMDISELVSGADPKLNFYNLTINKFKIRSFISIYIKFNYSCKNIR
ncbi:MAG: helix-turn-helix transcriptional regulator [Clostridia bacterium]|nr:helix-turn-helix transcriptional regulator [Clostridia bacterium]